MFKKIANSPLRKPLAVFIFILDVVVILYCVICKTDILTEVSNLLKWLNITILGGYFATSSIEHIKNKEE